MMWERSKEEQEGVKHLKKKGGGGVNAWVNDDELKKKKVSFVAHYLHLVDRFPFRADET
jgi:hypothetical protein